MDLLTYKCERLLKNFFSKLDNDIIEINYNKMIEGLKISDSQFLDLCLLLGCDYLPTLPGLGQVKSFDYIKKHESIENILENTTIKAPETYDYKIVQEYFTTASSKCIIPSADDLKIKIVEGENKIIFDFLTETCNFNIFKYRHYIKAKQHLLS
jgi:flap endonuclease-1